MNRTRVSTPIHEHGNRKQNSHRTRRAPLAAPRRRGARETRDEGARVLHLADGVDHLADRVDELRFLEEALG